MWSHKHHACCRSLEAWFSALLGLHSQPRQYSQEHYIHLHLTRLLQLQICLISGYRGMQTCRPHEASGKTQLNSPMCLAHACVRIMPGSTQGQDQLDDVYYYRHHGYRGYGPIEWNSKCNGLLTNGISRHLKLLPCLRSLVARATSAAMLATTPRSARLLSAFATTVCDHSSALE